MYCKGIFAHFQCSCACVCVCMGLAFICMWYLTVRSLIVVNLILHDCLCLVERFWCFTCFLSFISVFTYQHLTLVIGVWNNETMHEADHKKAQNFLRYWSTDLQCIDWNDYKGFFSLSPCKSTSLSILNIRTKHIGICLNLYKKNKITTCIKLSVLVYVTQGTSTGNLYELSKLQ